MNTVKVNWKHFSWWVGGLALLATLAAPNVAAAQRTVVAMIQEPFEVNGQRYDAGAVAVRQVSHYNPATTLNEIWVEHRCLGLMMADASDTTGLGGDDRMIFQRNPSGQLVLVGFAYRNQPEREFYGYETAATGGRWSAPAQQPVESIAFMNP